MNARVTLSALSVLPVACERVEMPEQDQERLARESQTVRAELEPIIARYERAVAAGNADSMALILAEDAHAQPPNAPAVIGGAAWLETFPPFSLKASGARTSSRSSSRQMDPWQWSVGGTC